MINWIKRKIYEHYNGPFSIEFNDIHAKVLKQGKYLSGIDWNKVDRIRAFKQVSIYL